MLTLDRNEARRFCEALNIDEAHFQTIDDDKGRKDQGLLRSRYGRFEELADELEALNQKGAGVFVTINRTRPGRRTADNVTSIRAQFVDLDGAPIEPVLSWGRLPPPLVVESSPSKFHAYWRADGSVPLDQFKPLQLALARFFGGDQSVHDLPRIMRLPGSWHQKVSREGTRAEPFMSRIVQESDCVEW